MPSAALRARGRVVEFFSNATSSSSSCWGWLFCGSCSRAVRWFWRSGSPLSRTHRRVCSFSSVAAALPDVVTRAAAAAERDGRVGGTQALLQPLHVQLHSRQIRPGWYDRQLDRLLCSFHQISLAAERIRGTAPSARFGVFAREEGVGEDDAGFVGGGWFNLVSLLSSGTLICFPWTQHRPTQPRHNIASSL
jgi:hypothetical protein